MNDVIPAVAGFSVMGSWWVLGAILLLQYFRMERRRQASEPSLTGRLRDRSSMLGLALEGTAFAVVFAFHGASVPAVAIPLAWAAAVLAPCSAALAVVATHHLGREFRIQAVVTADHQLIRTGPYRLVRHPIYASLLGMLLATAAVVARWEAALAAALVYVAGTEIRVRAEDRLLARRFGPSFEEYRRTVPAYIPFVR